MIELNLLPPGYKTVVRVERVNLSVRAHLTTLLVILVCASTPLFWARIYLSQKYAALVAQQQEILKNTQNFNNEVQEINDRIENIARLQSGFKVVTNPIQAITRAMPPTVTLTSFVLDGRNKIIVIHGVAKSRDDLLKLQNDLKLVEGVSSVDIPLSDLLEDTNVAFTIQANIHL